MARGNGDSDGGDVGPLVSGPGGRLKGREYWAVIIIAALTSGGGSTLFVPDRFTGTDGDKLEQRIEKLERAQVLTDDHLNKATGRFDRLRNCEREIDRIKTECRMLREKDNEPSR